MGIDVKRLGDAVSRRRQQLGLSQRALWKAGGPSNSTLTGIENGVADRVSPKTLGNLDRSLQWEPGSAKTVLDGGDPTPLPAQVPDGTFPHSVQDQLAHTEARKVPRYPDALSDSMVGAYQSLAQPFREAMEETGRKARNKLMHSTPSVSSMPALEKITQDVNGLLALSGTFPPEVKDRLKRIADESMAAMLPQLYPQLSVEGQAKLTMRALDLLEEEGKAGVELEVDDDDQVPDATARRDEDGE